MDEPGSAERRLMTAYVAGDPEAFDRLFARLAPRVYTFFHRAFRDSSIADDLVQTTFLKVHRARNTYDSARPLLPWLFTIAAAVRNDELRRRYRAAASVEADAGDPASPPDPVERRETADAVRAALARLPESQRVVLHLHRYEGLSFEEIAAILDTSCGAVRVRACRAYERLRSDLAPWLDGEEGRVP
jgi:RNA polymerase sigma-70 factor (ECF subfamily)